MSPLHPALYLLPLGPIFDAVGYLPPYLRLFFTYGLIALPLCLRPSKRAVVGALALLLVMGIGAFFDLSPMAELCLLLLCHQFVWALVSPVPSALTAGVAGYAFLHIFLFLSPLGYPLLDLLARAGSRTAGWITGSSYNLGYTYQGTGGLLLFICLSLSGWDRSRVSRGRTASFLGVALLANGFLCALLIRNVDFGADFAWKLQYREPFGYRELVQHLRGLALLIFPALVFLVQMLAYLLLHYGSRGARKGAIPAPPVDAWARGILPRHPRQASVILAALLLVMLAIPPTAWRRPGPSSVVFVERGVVSFTRPNYKRFGRAAGGMYGMLPDYVRAFGCQATVVPDIPADLEPGQVLVLTNLDEPLEPAVHKRVWDFVARGGRLWVLGDHTFIKNGRNHINDLLAPSHIRLKHDSAQFHPQGWFNSYRFRQGTAFSGLTDLAENRPAILVGASLELRPPAAPFIIGRFGYSDLGPATSDEKRGYLGDFEYQPAERLGDLVLVAGQAHGKGKVLVFGDTTSFFNNNLSRSYEILRSVLSWFGETEGWSVFAALPVRIGAGLVLAGLLALLFVFRSAPLGIGALLAAGLLSAIAHRPTGQLPLDSGYTRGKLALIDFSHQPYASRHSSMKSGLHGISINLMRQGTLPVTCNRWENEWLDAAGLLILNAPRRPFSAAERGDLTRFMQRGGTVLLGCGYPHYENCRALLDPLQLRIRGLPLGRFFDRTAFERPISFLSAWPVIADNPAASALCLYDDWPLIVSVPVGRGRMIVIGDSEFLHNRNLEGLENHDPANIQFIRSLLEWLKGSGPT